MTSLRTIAGRAVQGVYRAVPMSWELRLAVKDAVFIALAPLLSNTNVYKRWHAFRGRRLALAATRAADPVQAVPIGHTGTETVA
ncbi:MAG: hypothetical protein ACTHOH_02175, partial [Lysobacteraceae bacterium]